MASTLDLTITCGSTFSRTLILTDEAQVAVDLSNYKIRFKGRKINYEGDILFEATTENGLITTDADPSNGRCYIELPATTTQSINNNKATQGPYSVEFESPTGVVTKYLTGTVTIVPEANY